MSFSFGGGGVCLEDGAGRTPEEEIPGGEATTNYKEQKAKLGFNAGLPLLSLGFKFHFAKSVARPA